MAQASISASDLRIEVGGLRIFVRFWRPPGKVRGVITIVPGFNSHSGYYAWPAEQLAARGLAVYMLDLRGRGHSDGERFYVEKFADYINDVAAVVSLAKEREPKLPTFLLGHSAGGVVACLYSLEHPGELTGLICESFAHEIPAPDFALAVFKGLSHVAPHAHILHLKNEMFSRDPKVVEIMNKDPLIAHETQPTKTLAEMVRADERLKKEFPLHPPPGLNPPGPAGPGHKASGSPPVFDPARLPDKNV